MQIIIIHINRLYLILNAHYEDDWSRRFSAQWLMFFYEFLERDSIDNISNKREWKQMHADLMRFFFKWQGILVDMELLDLVRVFF